MSGDRITWEGGLGPMDQEKITDRNVAQLDFAHRKLEDVMPRSRPGSRPDGGMAQQPRQTHDLIQQIVDNENQLRANLVDARNIIDNFERDMMKLESELNELKAKLDLEKNQREHFEGMLRQIATLVVNGAKERP